MPVIPSRKKLLCSLLASIFAACTLPALADTSVYQEQGKLIRAPKAVTVLGSDLFGDQVNLYSGSLSFVQNDVSLPGNSGLAVSIGRSLATGANPAAAQGAFGNWELEVPRLHGIFAGSWMVSSGGRCSNFGAPPIVSGTGGPTGTGGKWDPNEYWHGSFLYVPGAGDQEMLTRIANPNVPADGKQYPIVTRNLWAISCLPSLKNAAPTGPNSGEGFLAMAPNGDRYQFDWIASRNADRLEKANGMSQGAVSPPVELTHAPLPQSDDGQIVVQDEATASATTRVTGDGDVPNAENGTPYVLNRQEVWILPTLVTDRFGNTVTYTYDATRPWQLQTISSRTVGGTVDRTINLLLSEHGSDRQRH